MRHPTGLILWLSVKKTVCRTFAEQGGATIYSFVGCQLQFFMQRYAELILVSLVRGEALGAQTKVVAFRRIPRVRYQQLK